MVKNAGDMLSATAEVYPSESSVMALLASVPDPEIPVISIVDLGIVREVTVNGATVKVTMTPTYSGCPAMFVIEEEIRKVLEKNGFMDIAIEKIFSPAWTTDWLSESAQEKLRKYGIAPPVSCVSSPLLQIELPTVTCPLCNSLDTRLTSEFGSTPCKSYYVCSSCRQPFEYLKSL
ncbi:MAG: 1,2-phenylacetyl-CoA epoxidase subunit PaaD [Bacteroidota bacterium]